MDIEAYQTNVVSQRAARHLAVAFPMPAQNAFLKGTITVDSQVDADAVGDDAEVRALALDVSLADRQDVLLGRHLAFDAAVATLVLEEEDRVVVPDRGLEQSLTVVRS